MNGGDRDGAGGASHTRVLILRAHIGEGHAAAARAVVRDLRADVRAPEIVMEDGVAAMGPLVRWVLEDSSRIQFRRLPWLYTATYLLLMHCGPFRWTARTVGYRIGGRRLLRLIRSCGASVVVSTYPGVTAVLGELRRRGRLDVPTVAMITDLTGLFFWAHPGIDLHLAAYRESVAVIERIAGAGSARVIAPPIAAEFLEPRQACDARRDLQLPTRGHVVAVSGGGWGVGDLEGAIGAALAVEPAAVVCLTGHNEPARHELARTFAHDPRVRVLGYSDRMSDVLAAADLLIHSTGGVTCLEARARSCPVVAYGFPVGHAQANAVAMARLGLVDHAPSRTRLREALERVLANPRPAPQPLRPEPAAGTVVLEARARRAPSRRRRPALRRPALASAALLAMSGWLLVSDDPYPVLANVMDARPVRAVATANSEVGLVIDARPAEIGPLTLLLRRQRDRASFALHERPPASTLAKIRASGSSLLPELPAPGRAGWLHIRRQLDGLGRPGKAAVLMPDSGMTFAHYIIARHYGRPVAGAVRLRRSSLSASRSLHRGEVVVLTLDSSSSPAAAVHKLAAVLASLERTGLEPVTVDELLGSAATANPTAGERPRATTPARAMAREASMVSVMGRERQASPATAGASSTGTAI